MEGVFKLIEGTLLKIVVGQGGGNSVEVKGGQITTKTAAEFGVSIEDNAGTGGGGGSFVYTTSNELLIAAGGGGGASGGFNGVDGQTGTSGTSSVGKDPSKVGKGGSDGQPGECNTVPSSYHGGVGAGWINQGCAKKGLHDGERGGSRAQDWLGGQAGSMNRGNNGGPAPGAVGGFGGGGGVQRIMVRLAAEAGTREAEAALRQIKPVAEEVRIVTLRGVLASVAGIQMLMEK